MGKKKTLEEKAKRAREKGYNSDDDNFDECLVLKELLPYTKGAYYKEIDIWH
jgi:hypothetical protein